VGDALPRKPGSNVLFATRLSASRLVPGSFLLFADGASVKIEAKTSDHAPKPEHANCTTAKTSEKLPRLAYTMRETAEILGVSYITVHRLLKRGKLRASDAIRSKIIPRAEIDRFLRDSIADRAA